MKFTLPAMRLALVAVVLLLACASVVYGVALLSIPVAFIVAGPLLAAWAVLVIQEV